jgi:MoxR-like ATPase
MLTIAAGTPLVELLTLAYYANHPVLLHGRHGVGKSEAFAHAAAQLEIGLIVCDLSVMEPPDLVGLPRVGEDGRTHYAPPAFLPQTDQGLLVFEELNRCPRYMQAPCLQLLTARQLN